MEVWSDRIRTRQLVSVQADQVHHRQPFPKVQRRCWAQATKVYRAGKRLARLEQSAAVELWNESNKCEQ